MNKKSLIIVLLVALMSWLFRLVGGNPALMDALKKLASVTWNS